MSYRPGRYQPTSIRIPTELKDRLKRKSEAQYRFLSDYILSILFEHERKHPITTRRRRKKNENRADHNDDQRTKGSGAVS